MTSGRILGADRTKTQHSSVQPAYPTSQRPYIDSKLWFQGKTFSESALLCSHSRDGKHRQRGPVTQGTEARVAETRTGVGKANQGSSLHKVLCRALHAPVKDGLAAVSPLCPRVIGHALASQVEVQVPVRLAFALAVMTLNRHHERVAHQLHLA